MKVKEISKMTKQEREKKFKELKLELIKAKAGVSKTGKGNVKDIKKMIARIMTFDNQPKKLEKGVEKHK